MIDWLLKNPFAIFVIIAGVTSLIKHLKSSGRVSPENSPRPMDETGDGDNDDGGERMRRLQEEIRRKIAERRGQVSPPPMAREEPEPAFPSPRWGEAVEEPSPYKLPEPPPLVETLPAADPALERQRELAAQFAALQAQREAAIRAVREIAKAEENETTSAARAPADVYGLRELRNARSLRKAMVLREVIGPPVALR